MRSERLAGMGFASLSVGLFSTFTLVSRLGLTHALKLPDLAALRFGIGGAVLLPVLLRHGLRGVSLRAAAALAVLGGLGFAPLAYAGFALAPAAHGAVLLHGTLPLFTALLVRLAAPPDSTRPRAVGLVLIAAGIALMARDSLTAAGARQLMGDGLLLLASLSWSGYGVLSRRLALPPAHGAAIVAGLSMAAFLPGYALFAREGLLGAGAREVVLQAVVQGVLIGAVSILVYTRAVAALGAAETALFTAAVPCITTVAAIPLLGERPTGGTLVGVAAVTVGMLVSLGAASSRPAASPRPVHERLHQEQREDLHRP